MSAAVEKATPSEPLPALERIQLTPKQKAFADNWLDRMPGVKAAELAGYSGDYAVLAAIASENLRKPQIASYITQRLQERHLSSDQVLAELSDIAGYKLDDIGPASPVKTPDKLKALELVGKYHKLFVDKVEVETADPKRLATDIVAALVQLRQQQLEAQESAVLAEGSTPSSE